jgi:hypothetical protein
MAPTAQKYSEKKKRNLSRAGIVYVVSYGLVVTGNFQGA